MTLVITKQLNSGVSELSSLYLKLEPEMEEDGVRYSCWTDDPVDELEDEIE